jgi:hypothetical protein
MRAYYVFEKFEEESDPIADMGMSRVKFGEIYDDIMKAPLKDWTNIVKDLVGKTLEGNMHMGYDMPYDATIGYPPGSQYRGGGLSSSFNVGSLSQRIKVKVVKAGIAQSSPRIIAIEDEKGRTYTLLDDEEYVIS